jgi:glutathione synthase/RimK-type ligase-like ATP-grasp enzyme
MTKTVAMTWLWRQPGGRIQYTAEMVNGWAHAIRDNTTLNLDIACVTDLTDGIESWIRIIKPPGYFETVSSPTWPASNGWPQCYRRLALFHPDAAQIFGGDRLISMDVDMLVTGNLDKLFSRAEPLVMFKGTNTSKRPYNGGFVMLDAGSRSQVFTEFTPEKAVESGKLFVGSDQAWISHCLGWGEATVSEQDGIVHYASHFISKHGGAKAYKHPEHVCMVMFPGAVKAFNGIAQIWGGARKDEKVIRAMINKPVKLTPVVEHRPKPDNSILWAYLDPKGWGNMFKEACSKKGVKCRLFTYAEQVPDGAKAFVRVDQQDTQREISKGMVAALAAKGCVTLPTAHEAELYDDKGAQAELLNAWMPETVYIKDKQAAIDMAEHIDTVTHRSHEVDGLVSDKRDYWSWPIYSKAIDGAGSKCVRKLHNLAEAMAEINAAWSSKGLPSAYTRIQRNYVLWQEYVPGNPCTLRITVVGDCIIGHERKHDKDGLPIPGENIPMDFSAPYQQAVAKKAHEVIDKLQTKWMCFDFLQDERGNILLLECSSAWPTKGWFSTAPAYTKDFKPTGLKGKDMFSIAVDVLRGL